jgi:hypothetical protein
MAVEITGEGVYIYEGGMNVKGGLDAGRAGKRG